MRTAVVFHAIVLTVCVVSSCADKVPELQDTPPDIRMFAVKSATLEYEYSGDATGWKRQYIANHGMYQRDEENFSIQIGDKRNVVRTMTVRNDTVQYNIDMEKREGTSSHWDLRHVREMAREFSEQQKENIAGEILLHMGATLEGTEIILGKTCDVYNMTGVMRVSMWKGLVLKSEMTMGALHLTLTATKIETDRVMDPVLFQPPEDITITPGGPGAS